MAHANSAYEESLRQVVGDATDVAVTHVDHRTPVTFVFDGEVHTCGFRYSGEISRPLKGDRGTLEFFGSTELTVGTDYLVLAFRTDPDEAKELAARGISEMEPFDRAKYLCRLEASHVFVRDDPRTAIPFSRAAADQLGGEWLVVEHPSPLSGEGFDARSLQDGTLPQQVVRWADVEAAIRRWLDQS